MMQYLMGIDAGTGGIRVTIYDPLGRKIAYHTENYETTYPRSGWAEQSVDQWWAALQKAVPACVEKSGVRPASIVAVACDATTNTLVFLDERNQPVRPPILWMDVRAAREAEEIDTIRSTHTATRFYRPKFRADTLLPKCMWLKKHEPEHWKATKTIMELEDWLNWKLTGKKAVCKSTAAFRWNYDDENGGYPVALYRAAGVPELTEKLPPSVLAVGDVIGTVAPEAARLLSLSPQTLVIEGTADCNACMVGVGCVQPGQLAMIGGTSTCLLGLSEKDFHADGISGTYPNCLYEGTSLLEGGQTTSGAILTWFRDNLLPGAWEREAAARGADIYALIEEKARQIPFGCGGLVMLDHFQGNRTPYTDSSARGMFWGLSMGTTTAHMARAVYEGVAYGANHCIASMQEAGYAVREIYACGGLTRSDFWIQMHADVMGIPIHTTVESRNAGCLGSCMIAAVGAGIYPSFAEAAAHMVHPDKSYTPDPAAHEAYTFYMERYRETWPQMEDIVHKTVERENGQRAIMPANKQNKGGHSMLLSVQTVGVTDAFGPEEGFRMIRQCGFEAIDWNIDLGWDRKAVEAGQLEGSSIFEKSDEEVLAYYAEDLKYIRENGLVITQAHAPFPSDVRNVPGFEEYVVRIYQSCIRLCAAVGCKRLIIHGGSCRYSDPHTTAQQIWDRNMAMYTALIPQLKKTDVMVCVENLFVSGKPVTDGVCSDPQEAVTMIDELNARAGQECFGLCLDTGHLNLLHKHVPTYVHTLGKRIHALHLHDNDSVSDQHLMPFVGNFRWREFLDAMQAVGYDDDISFETFCQVRADRMPPEYVPVFLRAIAGIGEEFRRKLSGNG